MKMPPTSLPSTDPVDLADWIIFCHAPRNRVCRWLRRSAGFPQRAWVRKYEPWRVTPDSLPSYLRLAASLVNLVQFA